MPLVLIGFLKRFGPWIAIGLAALFVYSMGGKIVNQWKDGIAKEAYAKGETTERNRQDAIARRIENILGPKIDAIDKNTQAKLDNQTKVETVYVDRIRTKIKDNPVYGSCSVDDSVLGDRNALRQSLQAAINPAAGSGSGSGPQGPTPHH